MIELHSPIATILLLQGNYNENMSASSINGAFSIIIYSFLLSIHERALNIQAGTWKLTAKEGNSANLTCAHARKHGPQRLRPSPHRIMRLSPFPD